MSGLIEKDIRLIFQRKQTLTVFGIIAIAFGFTMEGTFIMGYLPFLSMILAIGTISYDEFENGYAFLMTLPIDAKTYVIEKYVFCLGFGFFGWFLACAIYLLAQTVHGMPIQLIEDMIMNLSFLFLVSMVLSILIPVQLKFGIEKSRTVMMIIAGIVMAFAFLASSTSPNLLQAFVLFLDNSNQFIVFGVLFLITIACLLVSYIASCNIMKNKEF